MDERTLDRAIDAAAGTLMAREPSRALSYSVMARVRESSAQAPRRVVWVTATAGVVVCAAAALWMTRAPSEMVLLPGERHLPVAQAAIVPGVPVDLVVETPRVRSVGPRGVRTAPSAEPLPPSDVTTIDPIETQPIVLTAIDVPQLERETVAAIETINIEPITIEPLSASND